ncbi:GTP cyclohydrolase I, partial [Colwellia sp.]|uniref:GTP cyclohydrolase I n=1 Tax=Colwellia sp. TaxID=56799 RepID=UPI0025B8FDB7
MEQDFKAIIEKIGEDPQREGLVDTPKRAAKALKFLTQGYDQDLNTVINGALFSSDCDSMVVVNNIELYSLCEHHMLPFTGRCHIGYIP